MAQQRIGNRDGFEQVRCPITILNISSVNGKTDQQANRVCDDVTFAPFDPLASVIASHPATFSCFHALTVNHTRRWARCAPFGLTRRRDELAVQFPQQAIITPIIKVASHCRDGWKVIGQHAPLAPGRRDVEDRIEHLSQIGRPGPADPSDYRHHRRYQRPFCVSRIACIFAATALISTTSEFGPGHCDLRSVSQPNRITTY